MPDFQGNFKIVQLPEALYQLGSLAQGTADLLKQYIERGEIYKVLNYLDGFSTINISRDPLSTANSMCSLTVAHVSSNLIALFNINKHQPYKSIW